MLLPAVTLVIWAVGHLHIVGVASKQSRMGKCIFYRHKQLCCIHNVQWSAVLIDVAGASQLVACALSAKTRLSLFCSSGHTKMTFPAMCLFIFFLCITGLLKVGGLLTAFTQAVEFRNADHKPILNAV